jgi:sucrose-phosphate synthase
MALYIQLFSPHGLIRGGDPEVGKDRDTGGQVKYVLELLQALSQHEEVGRVDLFTRRIAAKEVAADYANSIEIINDKARIVRIDCGPEEYLPKEMLWDYLDEFTDRVIRFLKEEKLVPDVVHGHYADGNYIASQLAQLLNVPMVATGHSLGRNKKDLLLTEQWSESEIDAQFKINHRISIEEKALQEAAAVVVSTRHEIKVQYINYENCERANFHVLPPGINNDVFYPYYRLEMPGYQMPTQQELAVHHVGREIDRFLYQPEKPFILSIGRADKRKNFEAIIAAYGQDKELQAMANLVIFAGERNDIARLPEEEQTIFTNLLLLMDKYDLYGKMAIPKKNDPLNEIPEIYRLAARKRGVFVNATPGENFGLTIIEAAACGLPVIADCSGGPEELVRTCENGLLVSVDEGKALAEAMKKLIADQKLWEQCSANGIRAATQYSWEEHAHKYVRLLKRIKAAKGGSTLKAPKLLAADYAFVSDLDGTLIGPNLDDSLEDISQWIRKNRTKWIFGIATGRNKRLTKQAIWEYKLPQPDIMICSAGTEIYYGAAWMKDNGWDNYIKDQWQPEALLELLSDWKEIELQEQEAQNAFKISFNVREGLEATVLATRLQDLFAANDLSVQIYLTEGKYLDIVPWRAGKGNALKYLSNKWGLPMENFLTAGNGGNDIDMLGGAYPSIVVPGHDPELKVLRQNANVYFSELPLGKGIYEGINYFFAQQEVASER